MPVDPRMIPATTRIAADGRSGRFGRFGRFGRCFSGPARAGKIGLPGQAGLPGRRVQLSFAPADRPGPGRRGRAGIALAGLFGLSGLVFSASGAIAQTRPAPVAATAPDAPRWSFAIHGGAGVIERASLTPEQDVAYRAALHRALEAGSAVLANGAPLGEVATPVLSYPADQWLLELRHTTKPATCRLERDGIAQDGSAWQRGFARLHDDFKASTDQLLLAFERTSGATAAHREGRCAGRGHGRRRRPRT